MRRRSGLGGRREDLVDDLDEVVAQLVAQGFAEGAEEVGRDGEVVRIVHSGDGLMLDHTFCVVDEFPTGSDECGSQDEFDGDVDDSVGHCVCVFMVVGCWCKGSGFFRCRQTRLANTLPNQELLSGGKILSMTLMRKSPSLLPRALPRVLRKSVGMGRLLSVFMVLGVF